MFNNLPTYEATIYPDAQSWFFSERGKAIPFLAVYAKWLRDHGFVQTGRNWVPANFVR